jgi:hypothetical protein
MFKNTKESRGFDNGGQNNTIFAPGGALLRSGGRLFLRGRGLKGRREVANSL